MNRENWHDLDWLWGGMLIALIVLCFMLTSCASSRPCIPDVQIQEVSYPQPCVIHISPPPEPSYISYPPYEPTAAWYKAAGIVAEKNRAMRQDYINRLLTLIEEHNRLEPQCEQ